MPTRRSRNNISAPITKLRQQGDQLVHQGKQQQKTASLLPQASSSTRCESTIGEDPSPRHNPRITLFPLESALAPQTHGSMRAAPTWNATHELQTRPSPAPQRQTPIQQNWRPNRETGDRGVDKNSAPCSLTTTCPRATHETAKCRWRAGMAIPCSAR